MNAKSEGMLTDIMQNGRVWARTHNRTVAPVLDVKLRHVVKELGLQLVFHHVRFNLFHDVSVSIGSDLHGLRLTRFLTRLGPRVITFRDIKETLHNSQLFTKNSNISLNN